jgi:hypothetical protein
VSWLKGESLLLIGASGSIALVVFLVGAFAIPAVGPQVRLPSGPSCFEANVGDPVDSGITGSARLCVVDEAIRPAMQVWGLSTGVAYTAWFVYFDRPTECRANPCAEVDFLGTAPAGTFTRMDGVVADGTRQAMLWGDLRDVRLSAGSQVTLALFRHGPVSAGANKVRNRQLLMPSLPKLGAHPFDPTSSDQSLGVARAVFVLP